MFYVIYPKIGKVREKVEKLDILGKSRKFWKRRQIMTLGGVYCPKSIMVTYPFLGPRGPLVLPLVDPYVRTYALKILTPIYRHICLMNHQETPQTNPLAILDPLDVSLNPLGPPGPPITPLGPLKRSLGLIEL